ncbi:uncharacterized protein LOC129223103 [Uloborus diversus]|uniref:uncharacterized protein LOC129223103 n=1 Tax=Uloborus diversus TaxID=327109 RepID=UPI00240A06F6|nr:uncharacterized protein LOC129223103 [Uloborus diversus]
MAIPDGCGRNTVAGSCSLARSPVSFLTRVKLQFIDVMTNILVYCMLNPGFSELNISEIYPRNFKSFRAKFSKLSSIQYLRLQSVAQTAAEECSCSDSCGLSECQCCLFEEYFSLDGNLNKQNYRYWGRERSEITVVRSLQPKKILVWCAISSHGVFGPVFIDGTLSGAKYRKLLDAEFIPFLHGNDLVQGQWFMQDGARPHRTAEVFEMLNEHFSDRITGLDYSSHFQGGIKWPPHSSDLNPCDYYLWGSLKSKIWQRSPTNLSELKTAITTAVETIDSEAHSRVMVGFQKRLTAVLVKDGGHFKPLYH